MNEGFDNVKALKGGYDAWKAGGHAMETGSQ
jgi:rhodanese-related sulfurtransferase